MSLSFKNRKVKFSTEGLSSKSLAKIENFVITGLMNPVTAKSKKCFFTRTEHSVTTGLTNPILTGLRILLWHRVITGLMNPVPTRLKEKVENPL